MNREQMTVAAALTVAALALLAALLMGGYLLRTLNRMQKLLRDYREKGSAAFQTMKETRESRLESSLSAFCSRLPERKKRRSGSVTRWRRFFPTSRIS